MVTRLRKMDEKGNRADKDRKKPQRFAKACVITTSIITFGALAAGCGNDTVASDECMPNTAPADCRPADPAVKGIATGDVPLQMGNLFLRLEGTEEHAEEPGFIGIFSIEDLCGNVLENGQIREGQTKTFIIEGVEYTITVNKVHPSENGTAWADVTVKINCNVEEPPVYVPCYPESIEPIDCHSTEPIAQGIVSSMPLHIGNLLMYLEGTEEHADGLRGIFRIVDSCGNVLERDTILEGTAKTFVIEGAEYTITLNALHQSDEGSDWADVTVDLSCPPSDMCLLVSGILNQGEEIPFDGLKVRLDDIGMDSSTALLSILDSSNNILEKLSVAEGQSVSLHYGEYLLTVEEVSLGATFGAKWARVSVYSRNCD